MYTEEKKNNITYGSIFVYCCFFFVLFMGVAKFANPYDNLKSLMETEAAIVEGGFSDVENSGIVSCNFLRSRSASSRAKNQDKLSVKIREEIRSRPPTTYCVKFKSFPVMQKLVEKNDGKYESRPFSAGGYNWTFLIYPNVNKPLGSSGFVSLYVRIDNSTLIANPRDVYAEIKFLVYKSTIDKYHVLQETDAQRFHLFKQEFGQIHFLEIAYFQNPVHGFIFDGEQSVFGVDIFVAEHFKEWEVASFEENIQDPVASWKLTHFSNLNDNSYTSGSFSSGGRDWVFKVYPNGVGQGTGNSLSLFLVSASNERGYLKAKLRVIDQIRSTHVEKQVDGWPNPIVNGWGFERFIPLADIKDKSKGFLVDDTLKVEVEILSFSKTDSSD